MHKPLIPLTLAYLAGLLLGHGFLYFPFSITTLILLAILALAWITWLNKLTLRRALFIVIPCLAGMAAYLYSAAWFPSDHYTRLITPDKAFHELSGRIASSLDRDPERTGFVLELSKVDTTPVTGKIRVTVRGELLAVGYGDIVLVKGKLFEPTGFNNPGGFDYPEYLARSGISCLSSVKNADAIQIISRGSGIFRKVQDWRERIRQSFLASTSGPGSAILQAMVLGEEGGLTDDLRDQFMAAGVTHIISISGSHLGMVAVLCFGLIRGLLFMMPERFYHRMTLRTDPKNIAAWLTLPLVIFYTLLAGGQVATVRSLVMISAGLFAILFNRENALMHSLALAALLILVASPQALFDISFQLSFVSVLVIGYIVALWSELQIKPEPRFKKIRSLALLVIISLSTSLATAPLAAFYFNQISFAGLISNLIVVPFAGMVVVPLGLFSGILSLFTHHLRLAWLNQIVSDLFIGCVRFFSRLPFAEIHPPAPSHLGLLLYALFFISLFLYLRGILLFRFKPFEATSRVSRVPLFAMAVSGALLVLTLAVSFIPRQRTTVSFPDVGQGDCSLVELPGGGTILIDGGGTRDNRFDIGRRVLSPFLWNRGIRKLDLVVLSHPHPDHMNGLVAILNKFEVASVWESGEDTHLPGYDQFSQTMRDRNMPHRHVSPDDPPSSLGEARLRVLHPRGSFVAQERKEYAAENSRSLVVQVTSEGRSFLFTGDIGIEAEQDIMRTPQDLKTDLIKVPHHGSKSSSGRPFIERTNPAIAIVTVGAGNQYHHPSEAVMKGYSASGAAIYRTDRGGALMVELRKGRFEVTQWKERMLHRIDLEKRAEWKKGEQENAMRLVLRAAAI